MGKSTVPGNSEFGANLIPANLRHCWEGQYLTHTNMSHNKRKVEDPIDKMTRMMRRAKFSKDINELKWEMKEDEFAGLSTVPVGSSFTSSHCY